MIDTNTLLQSEFSVPVVAFGGFVVFATFLRIRISPFSSKSGVHVSEAVLSSIPESLLVTSAMFGVANVLVYLVEEYSFIGAYVWTFLNTPVTFVGWLPFEGFLAFVSPLARSG